MPWAADAASFVGPAAAEPQELMAAATQRGMLQAPAHLAQLGTVPSYPLPEKRMVAMIEGWRKQLNIQKIVLAGHSLGGYIAFNYAESYPDRVDELVLCSPCGLPRRPDAFGMTEAEFTEWSQQAALDDPDSASEFQKGKAVRRPRPTLGERLFLCLCCCFCPLIALIILPLYITRACWCGRSKQGYATTYPQNGMGPDFLSEWPPLPALIPKERARLYEQRASPPQLMLHRMLPCIGRKVMHLFVRMRFSDNGQWAESALPELRGVQAEFATGHAPLHESGGASFTKVSQLAMAEYLYCVNAFASADMNWGNQLFLCVMFARSYRSFGWMRRPIGHRLEVLLGLTGDGAEYYHHAAGVEDAAALDGDRGSGSVAMFPVCFLYGQDDWMDYRAAKLISDKAAQHAGRIIPVLRVLHSGHQVFVDNPEGFVQGLRSLVPL
eukprot:NODE_8426_length_1496_cov_9.563185.p1 GENE.NODE_8426_length_1496_cov_9.563185~~NODE_8426_length_1496_cov_9.563185.p1  ORF type:complete len:492 (+),score=79.50 NODE_8426_length_1496_cov_9.563185:161-1477(+)